MQHDIFISYSRKDTPEVNSLIDLLRREIPGIKIWYDIDGIETAEAFRTKIIKAIDQSNAIIFVCSDNSLESEYCEKEVMYAHRKNKTIIPYLLPGMELDGWLLFEFGNINCISASKPDEVSRMIKDIKKWVDSNEEGKDDSSDREKGNTLASQFEINPRTGEFEQKAKDKTLTDSKKESDRGFINGHEYVDLGLPSGVKWATYNIGASKPEEYGNYFAWGETQPKPYYKSGNSETYRRDIQWLKDHDYIDEPGNLKPTHDAARQNWGGTWRIPTLDEFHELIKHNTSECIVRNGVKGRLLRSKINGNSIYLPPAGRYESSLYNTGEYGEYGLATTVENSCYDAYYFFFNPNKIDFHTNSRYKGQTIRPVCD